MLRSLGALASLCRRRRREPLSFLHFESTNQKSDLKLLQFTDLSLLGEEANTILKGLILAQNERWRRGLGMQVERIPVGLLQGGSGERGSKAWVTYLGDGHSRPNGRVIPGDLAGRHLSARR